MDRNEEKTLAFWEDHGIFKKSVEARKGKKEFVFFEGPPTANGHPHIGHAETRAFKDLVLRYKTMRGYHVPRRAGWDTQGLPVEIEVEKELGLKTKKDIEQYGVKEFNKKCKESVWKYLNEWLVFSKRFGFWIDFESAYVTYKNEYLESLWWTIKEIWEKELLFEDNKIVHWCPRCETGLSSHELAQGYRKVKDTAVYVRFPIKSDDAKWLDTAILSWTTTPWTLPGNVALAVNKNEEYVRVPDPEKEGQWLVLGKRNFERLLGEKFFPESFAALSAESRRGFSGSELLGLSYEPPFNVPELENNKAHRVYHADFVSMDEGVGVVHTAVMYGEDDYQLGKEIGLPAVHTVDERGHFKESVGGELAGKYVKEKETERLIIGHLASRGFLYKEEEYEHDYPFCWRCKSPILQYARKSWWIGMSTLRKELLDANSRINWTPEHIREGRFGEWLREVKDWAFSRSRYWGTPLPIWRCKKCGNISVIGSLEELGERIVPFKNRYILMRHGEADTNVKKVASTHIETDRSHLTENGKKEVVAACKELKKKRISPDIVVSSDIIRTKETAEMMRKHLALSDGALLFDGRLRDYDVGIFDGKPYEEHYKYFSSRLEQFTKPPPDGETFLDIRKRMLLVLRDLEEKHKGKTILIVSHAAPLWLLETGIKGLSPEESLSVAHKRRREVGDYFATAETRELTGSIFPVDDEGLLDLHRPYIDDVALLCEKCGAEMRRVPELADVWFDSGAMPYAQWHYPFEHQDKIDKGEAFPADFITEAVDQTRGWFYTLLAVSTLLGKGAPYKSVISLGFVLDKNGKKMSKSLGNVVYPMDMIEKYGADALRWYFFTVNRPGDDKFFYEKDLAVKKRNFLDIFRNSFLFWNMYKDVPERGNGDHILDRWIQLRMHELVRKMTALLDAYSIVEAARELEKFVGEDLSRWYIRRSRSRIKAEGASVLREVLHMTSILASPFVPFIAEEIYRAVGGEKPSVHLEDWPSEGMLKRLHDQFTGRLLKEMSEARRLASLGLEARMKAGLKVRQPLALLKVRSKDITSNEVLGILKDELNVKAIETGAALTEESEVRLDTALTDELRREGALRELIREVQRLRKDARLGPADRIRLRIGGRNEIRQFEKMIMKEANVQHIEWVKGDEISIL